MRPTPRSAPIPASEFVEAVWRHGGPRGDVLPVGSHELTRGAARFALGDGLEARLRHTTAHVALVRGAVVEANAVGRRFSHVVIFAWASTRSARTVIQGFG